MSESGEAPRIGVQSEGEQEGGMPWVRSLSTFRRSDCFVAAGKAIHNRDNRHQHP